MDELGALADRWGHRVSTETRQKIGEVAGSVRRAAATWDYDPDDPRDDAIWRDVLTTTMVMFVTNSALHSPAPSQPASVPADNDGDMDTATKRGTRATGRAQNRRKSVVKPVMPSDAHDYSRWLTTAEKQAIDAHQPAKYRARAKPGLSVGQVLDFELYCELGNRNFWTAVPSPRTVYGRRRWFGKNGVWDVLQTALNEPKSILCRQIGEQRRLELLPVVERLCREAESIGSGDRRAGKFRAINSANDADQVVGGEPP